MAVIMVEVPEAASRLDEMVDEVLGGEQVVVTRDGRPVGMLVPFEGRGRPGDEGAPFGGGFAEVPEKRGAWSGLEPEIIIVRRRVSIMAYMP